MEETTTAEQYLDDDVEIALYNLRHDHPNLFSLLTKKLIGFAAIHCKVQQEAILESAYINTSRDKNRNITSARINKESVLTAYPVENIK